ncbi:MAG: ABC transporter substrate-binding protein [Candidatus Binatia bacterium]
MRKLLIGLNLLVLSMYPIQIHAGTAYDVVKSRMNEAFEVLRDPALQGESANKLKRKKILSILDNVFDYVELSKRTLSRNWNKLTPNQREEFQRLYKTLLEKVYLDKILAYSDQEVVFGKERTLGQNKVEVESKIVSGSLVTPIHFRMILKNGIWRAYDVVIEGISLVKNYRSQFKRVIKKKSLEGMLEVLRKKVSKIKI